MPAYSRPLLNMMEFAYRIRNWPEHFETSESRKIKGPLSWIAVPTKHDGRGYKRAIKNPHAVQAMCGWWSLLQVAAKMPVHGLLADRDGPLDAEDIADKTGLPKKIYLTALDLMAGDKIGWLEKLPWDKTLDFAGNIAALVGTQRLPAGALEYQRGSAGNSGHQRNKKEPVTPGNASGPQRTTADSSGPRRIAADSSGEQQPPADASLHNRQDKTDKPPAVPQGGQHAGNNLIKNPEIAKTLICEKILRGKDPARAWSHQAMFRLSELCAPPGMPLQEILDVAEWRSIPKTDDVPELKFRVEPITETGLMGFWGDEVGRARAYLAKYRRNGSSSEKKQEPKLWREFFRWKYTEDCQLPATFSALDDDQKQEWAREHEDWENSEVVKAS